MCGVCTWSMKWCGVLWRAACVHALMAEVTHWALGRAVLNRGCTIDNANSTRPTDHKQHNTSQRESVESKARLRMNEPSPGMKRPEENSRSLNGSSL